MNTILLRLGSLCTLPWHLSRGLHGIVKRARLSSRTVLRGDQSCNASIFPRRAWPAARITWLAGKGPSVYGGVLAPLVRELIDELVEDAGADRRWRELLGLPLAGTPLAGRGFDLIIDSQRRVPTSLTLRRVPHRFFVSGAAGSLLSDRKPPGGGQRQPADRP
jgi:hypothetical protein